MPLSTAAIAINKNFPKKSALKNGRIHAVAEFIYAAKCKP